MEIKLHKVDESVKLAHLEIKQASYEIYYFSRAAQLCIQKDQAGTVLYNVKFGSFMTIAVSDTDLKIEGNSLGFNSNKA